MLNYLPSDKLMMPYLIAFCITVLIPILNAADESLLS